MGIFDNLRHRRKPHEFNPDDAKVWAESHFTGSRCPIAAVVAGILVEQVGMPWNELAPSTRFFEDVNVYDDFDATTYVDAVEQRFGITIPERDRQKIHRISDLVEYLHQKSET